jgi:hypothetical protein
MFSVSKPALPGRRVTVKRRNYLIARMALFGLSFGFHYYAIVRFAPLRL